MTRRSEQDTLWWMYINNKKTEHPITIDEVKKYCNRFHKLNFKIIEYLLVKGVSLKFPEGKIQLKPASNLNLRVENLISEAL